MVLNWPVFKKHSPADGPSLHAQDNLHSHRQHLIILQSDRGWGNSLLDTRYSEHAGPRVSNKFVKLLPISPEPNISRRDLVTAKLCLRPQYIFAKSWQTFGYLLSLVLSQRNNNGIDLGTSTNRPFRGFVCDKFCGDRSDKRFPAPPGDRPTTFLHHKMDRPNRGRPSRGRII
jgi:hypothetical protein